MREKQSQLMKKRNTNSFRIYTDEQLHKWSERSKAFNQEYWSVNKRKEHSARQKQFVKDNPHLYNRMAGRAGVYEVVNLDGESLKVRGSWEKKYVEWCNINNIRCLAPNQPFFYLYEGEERSYFPDFYLPEKDLWIEVKGYETEKDRMKWKYFPHELYVVRKNDVSLQ
jgi:hypothetical protein